MAQGKTFYAGDKTLKTGTAPITKFASGVISMGGYGTRTTITLGWRPRYVFVQLTQTKKADNYSALSYIDGLCTGFCRTDDRAYYIQSGSLDDITPTATGFVAYCSPHNANMYGSGNCYFFDGFGETPYWAFG